MRDFDRLPKLLRDWLNGAALPWRPKSVYRAYNKALRQTGNSKLALKKLEKLQQQKLSVDQNFWKELNACHFIQLSHQSLELYVDLLDQILATLVYAHPASSLHRPEHFVQTLLNLVLQ